MNGRVKLKSDQGEIRISPHLHEPQGSTMGLFGISAEQEHSLIKLAQDKRAQVHTDTIR